MIKFAKVVRWLDVHNRSLPSSKNPHFQNEARCTTVEGLNVINDPKCNKVLNVITFCPKCNKILSCK